MKKLFTFLLMAAMSMAVMAEKELYGVLESGTLTIFYDEARGAKNGVVEWWNDDAIKAETTTVLFDASVADARPTSTAGWFMGFELLSTVTDMDLLNTEDVTDMSEMFSYCKLLTSLDFSTHNTSKVTNMYGMFYGCEALTFLDVSFDTKNVTDMSWMFYYCDALPSLDVTGFDTKNVTNMQGMFADCHELTSLDLSTFNTENVTNMQGMFAGCHELVSLDLSTFDTENVTDMEEMFRDCWKLEEVNLSSFDTKNVLSMYQMFSGCWALKSTAMIPLKLTGFNTSKVTTMYQMFEGCYAIEYLNLTSFNTENVENMSHMFSYCNNLVTIDGLGSFNTGKVENMSYMFSDCNNIDFASDDFLSFNTRNVTNMKSMFQNCSAVTELDLRSFSMSKVENTERMFEGCSNMSVIICSDDWSAYENITSSDDMFNGCDLLHGGAYTPTIYDAANPMDKTYAHVDEGTSNPGYFTTGPMELYTVYDPETKVLTYHYDVNRPKHDGIVDLVSNKLNYSKYYQEAEKVVIEPAVQLKSLTDMEFFFGGLVKGNDKSLEKVKKIEGLNYINTSDVTNYNFMFWEMKSIDSLDLSSFHVENATSMESMFDGCNSLKYVNLSSFNKSGKVTNFDFMFANCSSLESLDVRMLDTHSATTMEYMFSFCTSLKTLDLSYFNTEGVNSMHEMFYGCSALVALALDRFSASSLTNVESMFYGCTKLKTIWCPTDFSGVPNSIDMFFSCESLEGSKGTAYDDANPKDKTYAHIDGGSGYEGYFSERGTDKLMYTVYNPVSRTLSFNYDWNFYSTPYNPGSSIPELLEDKVLFRDYCNEIETAWFDYAFYEAPLTHGGDLFHQFLRDGEGNVLYVYTAGNIISISGWENLNTNEMTDMSYMFYGLDDIDLKVLDLSTFNTDKVTDMSHMFEGASSTTKIDLSNFNTENVTNMNSMFSTCSSLTELDLSKFDTKNVTDMSWMFSNCGGLDKLDVSGFKTDKVTDMAVMFGGCYNLTSLDVTKFDTKKVENMSNMFAGCNGLTSLDVSKLNTELVRDMSYMFGGCTGLTELDVKSFKTDSVRDMGGMFSDCSELTSLDLSSFHTDSVERMPYMFQMCSKLESVDLSSFNAGKVVSMENMFYDCSALKQLDLSSFHTDSIHYAIGMFSNCTALEKIDLSTFHAPKLQNASFMFYSCPKLTRLDLSAFESEEIRDLNSMFAECAELKYVDISSFGRDQLISVYGVFENCAKLDTIVCNDNWKLTKTLVDEYYSSARIFAGCDVLRGPLGSTTADYAVDLADDYVHINYAHVDEGVSKPGFFTPKLKVVFVDADESELKTEYVVYGHAATEPAKPTKEGYHFVKWDQDFDAVKDNLTIKPVFEINTYKVTFVAEHGTITSDPVIADMDNVEHGTILELSAKPEEGYELVGWENYDGMNLIVTSDTTVTALFKQKEYKVTFVAEHGTITSDPEIADMDHVIHGSEFVLTATPEEGYDFKGWTNYDGSKLVVTSDTTVTANFTIQTFTVKFLDINGDQIGETQIVEWGKDAIAPEAPEVEGYTFTDWDNYYTNVKGNLVVNAVYELNTYKVTLIAEHGEITSDPVVADMDKVEHGTELVLTATPDEGYDFDKWTNYNGTKLIVTSDTTVTALFKIQTFTVIFQDENGTELKKETVEWGKSATAPEDPTKEGWTFAGWDKAFNVVKSDLTVTATYTKNPVYIVTFIDYDESVIAEVKVEEGKDAVAPDDPIREGYHFTGWDKAFNNVTEDITVTAQYAINTYTVIFLGFDDVKLGEQVVEHGQAAPGVTAPPVAGYIFIGWDTDYTSVTKDLTVKAVYEKDLTPKNLKVSQEDKDGDQLITLSWDKVDGVPSYELSVFNGEDELFTSNTFGENVVEKTLSELVKKYEIKPGTYTIHWAVRSTNIMGVAVSDWAEGDDFTITVKSPGPGTGVESIQHSEVSIQKVLREGHIYIIVGDKTFDASGRLVK